MLDEPSRTRCAVGPGPGLLPCPIEDDFASPILALVDRDVVGMIIGTPVPKCHGDVNERPCVPEHHAIFDVAPSISWAASSRANTLQELALG